MTGVNHGGQTHYPTDGPTRQLPHTGIFAHHGAPRRRRRSALLKRDLYEKLDELYNLDMATMSISEARDHLPDAMETARTEAVFVQRRGRLAGVLVSPDRYEQLMTALEDAEDVAAFDAAMAEEGPNIPWEQVKADLGWE